MAVVQKIICLPEELWHAAQAWAAYDGDVNTVLLRAVEEYLTRRHEDQVERRPGKYATLVASLSAPVEDLHLSTRAATCLRMLQIRYVYELVERSPLALRMQRNFGPKSLREVEAKLAALGLTLGMALDPASYAAAVTATVVASIRAAQISGTAPWSSTCPEMISSEANVPPLQPRQPEETERVR